MPNAEEKNTQEHKKEASMEYSDRQVMIWD